MNSGRWGRLAQRWVDDSSLPHFFDAYLKEGAAPLLIGGRHSDGAPLLIGERHSDGAPLLIGGRHSDGAPSTGDATRWHTGLALADVVYPDRAEEDLKLLTYTSPPMAADVELTGNPIVTLYVASTAEDGSFHVYLEDVAPGGRVTYITEGILRAIHRPVSDAEPPYQVRGPYHSLERAAAASLVPGEVSEVRLSLYATSVLIRKGHRVRLAIAGHDASVFARYPAQGDPVISVQRNSLYPSHADLLVMERE